jgi:hypothetical protein
VRERWRQGLVLALGSLALAACTGDPAQNPAWTLDGQPGLLFPIKQFYEARAFEENGRCTAPLLEGVTQSRVTEKGSNRLMVDLGYYYRDMGHNGDDCERFRPLRCGVFRECQGFAERRFTVEKTANGFKVIEMSGPQQNLRR